MSQTEFFTEPTTVLRLPSWLGRDVHEDRELPLAPGDYKVTPGERWTVTSLKTNEVVYDGIGPVELRRERANARSWASKETDESFELCSQHGRP